MVIEVTNYCVIFVTLGGEIICLIKITHNYEANSAHTIIVDFIGLLLIEVTQTGMSKNKAYVKFFILNLLLLFIYPSMLRGALAPLPPPPTTTTRWCATALQRFNVVISLVFFFRKKIHIKCK